MAADSGSSAEDVRDLNERPLIFLSYSHEQSGDAKRLCEALKAEPCNLQVQMDILGLEPGESIAEYGREWISKADATICLISSSSLESSWVLLEAAMALQTQQVNPDKRLIACVTDRQTFNKIDHGGYELELLTQINEKINSLIGVLTTIARDHKTSLINQTSRYERFIVARDTIGKVLHGIDARLAPILDGDTFENWAARIAEGVRNRQSQARRKELANRNDIDSRAQVLLDRLASGEQRGVDDDLRDFADKFDPERRALRFSAAIENDANAGHGETSARKEYVEKLRDQCKAPPQHEQIPAVREIVVECRDLGKSYRRSAFALRKIELAAHAGEILGLVGRNGNGKTTLFRLLVGELRPDFGRLLFPAIQADAENAKKVQWPLVRQHIAYVPQELPPWYGSLRNNLHYEAAIHGIRGEDNEYEVKRIIDRLGLAAEIGKRWHELSGGFRLRFALARALVWKPRLLLLDEPLANLDFLAQQELLETLRKLTQHLDAATIITSQHLHEIEAVADKLLVLNAGKTAFFGTVDELGRQARTHRFEINGRFDEKRLTEAFEDITGCSVVNNGLAFVLTTPNTIVAADVMRRLLNKGISASYFRDISRSVKGLLQEGVNAK